MEEKAHTPKTATYFEFAKRTYQDGSPDIVFTYKVHFENGDTLDFTETITVFDAKWVEKVPEDLKVALLEDLHLVLGVSYYKLFCPKEFKTDIALSQDQVEFWNTLYTRGLGEFLYRNNIHPNTVAQFSPSPEASRKSHSVLVGKQSVLVGIGGGKDSIVSLELLKDYNRTGFVVETGKENPIVDAVAQIAGVPTIKVKRTLDAKLVAGVEGSYYGHVPISAVYAFLGIFEAVLNGHAYVIVSNEYSSNFGNLMHEGNEVNHQWSKSSEFETLFQKYIHAQVTPSVVYFSLLRPFYELRIVKLFTELGREYFSTFSSCNKNFTHAHEHGNSVWCGECPKCAFAFLMLSAFLSKDEVLGIFKKDLFEDRALLPLFTDILGYGTMKPFDCVGTFDESRVALLHARSTWGDSYIVQAVLPLLLKDTLSVDVFKAYKAPSIPSQFRLLGMESALVLGYGKEGHANEAYLTEKYPDLSVGIADAQDGEDYLSFQEEYDVVLKTPVIPYEMVTRQCVTGTELFFSEVGKEAVIGVTGSKGKSTTATLLYLMLKEASLPVRFVGNIGVPALQEILENPPQEGELFVFELSSYQLEDLDVSPHIAVVTSLFPEHLDHHGSLENYYGAKQHITTFQEEGDAFVYAEGFPLLEQWATETLATPVTQVSLPFPIENKSLRGDHMKSNVELAYTVAKMFGVTNAQAQVVVHTFAGLPHRLQHIGTFNEIAFYDDSISTTPESTIAGIRALGNVDTIILGGVDRGYNFTELEKELHDKKIRNIILFPVSGEHMLTSEEGFTILHTSSMEEAVQFAYAHTEKGKACLLSPSAPSYNLFTNFEERGNVFSEAVKKYGAL